MARCFCGCERKVPFGLRMINRRGRLTQERLGIVEQCYGREVDDPRIQEWYSVGDSFVESFTWIVHEDAHPSLVEPSEVTAWQKGGQRLERQHKKAQAEMGLRAKRRMKELGMTPEEYLRAIGSGELEPKPVW